MSWTIAIITLMSISGGVLLSTVLRRLLPEHHLREDSRDAVKTATGTMATLVALVIGLLVSSAKTSFDATSTALTQGGAKIITLDHILSRYGPQARDARAQLRRSVVLGIERIWPGDQGEVNAFDEATGMDQVYDKVRDLSPQNEAQQHLRSQALQLAGELMQSRWLLLEQSQNHLPTIFLVVLISWLTALFLGLSLLAPPNVTALSALFVCALSMSGAVFLVLELSHPLEGVIKVPSAPLQKALTFIGQ